MLVACDVIGRVADEVIALVKGGAALLPDSVVGWAVGIPVAPVGVPGAPVGVTVVQSTKLNPLKS